MTNETELLQAVQQLADKDVAPFDLQIDRQAKLPNGLFQKIVDLGLLRAKILRNMADWTFPLKPPARSSTSWPRPTPVSA